MQFQQQNTDYMILKKGRKKNFKMNYHFTKFCFDAPKPVNVITECNLLPCEEKYKFHEYFYECKNNKKDSARFYCLDRKELG